MSSEPDRPRVLVVGAYPFSRSRSDGITLSNLFQGWPAERLAQVHLLPLPTTTDVCSSYFRIGPRNSRLERALRRMLAACRKPTGSGRPASGNSLAGPAGADNQLLTHLRVAADLIPSNFPPDLMPWLRQQRPDLVYSLLGGVRVNRLALRIARELEVPLVPHFMDDWPSTMYKSGEVFGLARIALLRTVRAVIRQAPQGLCISRPMAEEYEHRFGIPFDVFANCVGDDVFADSPSGQRPAGGPLELVYVGGLHLGRCRSLVQIAASLDRLAGEQQAFQLTIHTPESDLKRFQSEFDAYRSVRLGRWLPGEEVPEVLRRADVLVHVESFAPDHRRYTRLSLSTKIPQYLAAGRPVLGYGPAEVASMQHIAQTRAGLVVGAAEPEALREALRQLLDVKQRQYWGGNGLEYARSHHRREVSARRFAVLLGDVRRGRAHAQSRRS
jgi:glycosyltransferase involved in cell wall biosynthesis